MTTRITEGQTNTVSPSNTLLYPGINSCLAITTVLPQTTRLGGHAILVPDPPQQDLQQICNYLNTRKNADMLYIIGDIATWNGNWANLPQCKNLRINNQAVNNVAGIATALGYADNHVIVDINDWLDEDEVGTFDIYFGYDASGNRKLWAIKTADGTRVTVPNHNTW